MQAKPAVAREVILSSLINARQRFDWSNYSSMSRNLDIDDNRSWLPPTEY